MSSRRDKFWGGLRGVFRGEIRDEFWGGLRGGFGGEFRGWFCYAKAQKGRRPFEIDFHILKIDFKKNSCYGASF